MSTGNYLGNLVALPFVAGSVIAGLLFSVETGAIVYVAICYAAGALIWLQNWLTRPSRDAPFCIALSDREFEAFATYHIFVTAPGAAQVFSAFLNVLRMCGLIWAGVSFWNGIHWVGGLLVVYLIFVSSLVARLDAWLYVGQAAAKGSPFAVEQWSQIEYLSQLWDHRDASPDSRSRS